MATHPSGITVEVVGTEASSNSRSCEEHDVCGSILADDVIVRLRKVQIVNAEGMEETAIAANWVSDGIDHRRVGFLRRHVIKHCKHYDGALAQITEIYSAESESPTKQKKNRRNVGSCLGAAIISSLPPALPTAVPTHNKRQKKIEEEDPNDKYGNDEDKDENANDMEDKYNKN